MTYQRQPQAVVAGRALRQNPPPTLLQPAGIVPVTLEVDVASTTSLGVVQVGSGLAITSDGILSTINNGANYFVNVTLVGVNYTATVIDLYIGATEKNIEITLPSGILGRVYYIKNQATGNIKVKGSGGETINGATFQTLGANASFIVVFDGTQWNVL